MRARDYLGFFWPPAIMPVRKSSVDDMMKEEANREWFRRYSKIYDRRAWWLLGITTAIWLLVPYAFILVIPAMHIRLQIWFMIKAVKSEGP